MSQKLEKFHKYLDRYEQMVKLNAAQHVGEHLAEDVAQETFLKMYLHLDYLNEAKLKTWLIVISENIAKDYLRKGGEYQIDFINLEEIEEYIVEKYESAEETIEKEERRKAALKLLRTACDLLYAKNPNWYYIMIDSCMLEMTSPQIGKVLNLSTTYVDVMKVRARKYLRKKLGKQFEDIFN